MDYYVLYSHLSDIIHCISPCYNWYISCKNLLSLEKDQVIIEFIFFEGKMENIKFF